MSLKDKLRDIDISICAEQIFLINHHASKASAFIFFLNIEAKKQT